MCSRKSSSSDHSTPLATVIQQNLHPKPYMWKNVQPFPESSIDELDQKIIQEIITEAEKRTISSTRVTVKQTFFPKKSLKILKKDKEWMT